MPLTCKQGQALQNSGYSGIWILRNLDTQESGYSGIWILRNLDTQESGYSGI